MITIAPNATDSQLTCGIGSCAPSCLQKFSNSKVFVCFLCLVGILQGTYYTYFLGIVSTLERRYAFDSSYTGLIFIADNISHVLFSVLVGYYGKHFHRPRVLTFGILVSAISCFLSATPYFKNGSKEVPHSDHYSMKSEKPQLCMDTYNISDQKCNRFQLAERNVSISILFMANFLNGCGSLIYYTIGISYLDDNIKKKQSPLYLGMIFCSKIFAPTIGFYLSSICLKMYENPFIHPEFTNSDPRWIGSWWIGFLLIGIILTIASLPIALFPNVLKIPVDEVPRETLLTNNKKKKGIFQSLKKLLRNRIFIFHTLSITFQINGIFGYYTFMSKYMESQYRQTASKASFFSGTIALFTSVFSVLLGSSVIQKWKPRPTLLVGYMLFVELFATGGLIAALFFGCSTPPLYGLQRTSLNSYKNCSEKCSCSDNSFAPVCSSSEGMFYSPCHAGCSSYTQENASMTFHNCSCSPYANEMEISRANGFRDLTDHLKSDSCDIDCDNFLPYFVLLTLGKIFAFTAKVGNFLITLRCVPEEEKALAISVVEFVVSILATIPYPLIYGHIIDGTCLVWEKNCGRTGNCLLYDNDKFRNRLHLLSIGFLSFGCICELVVLCLSKNLKDFYGKRTGKNGRNTVIETPQL